MSKELKLREGAGEALEHIRKYNLGYKEVANRYSIANLEDLQRELGIRVDRTENQEAKVKKIVDAVYRTSPDLGEDETVQF